MEFCWSTAVGTLRIYTGPNPPVIMPLNYKGVRTTIRVVELGPIGAHRPTSPTPHPWFVPHAPAHTHTKVTEHHIWFHPYEGIWQWGAHR